MPQDKTFVLDQTDAIVVEYVRNNPRCCFSAIHDHAGGGPTRLIDRALQRLRKAGKIEHVRATKLLGAGWKAVQ